MKDNAVCKVCGRSYRICGHCPSTAGLSYTPWRKICDTSDCYGIFLAVWGYNSGQNSAEETKEQLSKLDLGRVETETFDPDIKKVINKLMSPNRSAKKSKNKVTAEATEGDHKEDDKANDFVQE